MANRGRSGMWWRQQPGAGRRCLSSSGDDRLYGGCKRQVVPSRWDRASARQRRAGSEDRRPAPFRVDGEGMGTMSGVEIILLCEDKQTNTFVRRFLQLRKFGRRHIHTLPLPDGAQSGEQWVRKSYPRELKAIRQTQGKLLIVVIDADKNTTERRHEQLRSECIRQDIPPRSESDKVLHIIPRRNIETWFAYLGGADVDEDTQYPRLNHESDCAEHARRLYKMCQEEQRLREPAPPSLRDACDEYLRLQRKKVQPQI